jgi:N4-gp56 family major capsid protein
MADAFTQRTTTKYDTFLVKFVRAKLLEQLRAGLVSLPAGSFEAETYSPGGNDTYEFPGVADLGVNLQPMVNDITNPPIEQLASYSVAFNTTWYARSVGWTSELARTQKFPVVGMIADKVARDVLLALDEVARQAWLAVHAGEVWVGDGTAELTADMLVNAVGYARSLDIPPIGDSYVLLANPWAIASLQREVGDKAWTEAVKWADPNALMTGVVGKFRGVTLVSSSRWLPAGAATKATCVLVGKSSLAIADLGSIGTATALPIPSIADPLGLKGVSSWVARLGATPIARQVVQGNAATAYSHIKLDVKHVVPPLGS